MTDYERLFNSMETLLSEWNAKADCWIEAIEEFYGPDEGIKRLGAAKAHASLDVLQVMTQHLELELDREKLVIRAIKVKNGTATKEDIEYIDTHYKGLFRAPFQEHFQKEQPERKLKLVINNK